MNFGQRERVERGLAVISTAASAIARWTQRSLIGLLLALGVTQALAQSAAVPQPYTEVFYPSGPLRIQAYLYRPPGDGPFPLVIYNHGSRANSEREPRPFSYVGRILLRSGYAVLAALIKRSRAKRDLPRPVTINHRRRHQRRGPGKPSPIVNRSQI